MIPLLRRPVRQAAVDHCPTGAESGKDHGARDRGEPAITELNFSVNVKKDLSDTTYRDLATLLEGVQFTLTSLRKIRFSN